MSRSDTMKNALAQGFADAVAELSLHNGDPGTTGANDLAPGIPHAAVTWSNPPDAGVIVSDPVSFTVTSGTVVTHIGAWDGSGNFMDSIANNLTFSEDTAYAVAASYSQEN